MLERLRRRRPGGTGCTPAARASRSAARCSPSERRVQETVRAAPQTVRTRRVSRTARRAGKAPSATSSPRSSRSASSRVREKASSASARRPSEGRDVRCSQHRLQDELLGPAIVIVRKANEHVEGRGDMPERLAMGESLERLLGRETQRYDGAPRVARAYEVLGDLCRNLLGAAPDRRSPAVRQPSSASMALYGKAVVEHFLVEIVGESGNGPRACRPATASRWPARSAVRSAQGRRSARLPRSQAARSRPRPRQPRIPARSRLPPRAGCGRPSRVARASARSARARVSGTSLDRCARSNRPSSSRPRSSHESSNVVTNGGLPPVRSRSAVARPPATHQRRGGLLRSPRRRSG